MSVGFDLSARLKEIVSFTSSFTVSSRSFTDCGVFALTPFSPLTPFYPASYPRLSPFGPACVLPFTNSITESSRSFTDAGESAMSIHLHGDLHGSFTELHGCLFFETEA